MWSVPVGEADLGLLLAREMSPMQIQAARAALVDAAEGLAALAEMYGVRAGWMGQALSWNPCPRVGSRSQGQLSQPRPASTSNFDRPTFTARRTSLVGSWRQASRSGVTAHRIVECIR